jgi:hypothetical protein
MMRNDRIAGDEDAADLCKGAVGCQVAFSEVIP